MHTISDTEDRSPAKTDDTDGRAPRRKGYKISRFKTARAFAKCGSCSECMMHVIDRAFDHPMEVPEHGVMPLAGGINQQGYQCGLLWGATMAAGAQAHQVHGPGTRAEAAAVEASKALVASFRELKGTTDCFDITDIDWKTVSKSKWKMVRYFLSGGPIRCLRLSTRFAPVAFDAIGHAMSQPPAATGCNPVSCAAELVKKAGLDDEHAAMAAGLAGGMGLSGGGCGALGAAVWIVGMAYAGEGFSSYELVSEKASEVVERFLKASDYEFECAEIVGRTFEDLPDHAAHLRDGGCAELIEMLASAVKEACSSEPEAPEALAA